MASLGKSHELSRPNSASTNLEEEGPPSAHRGYLRHFRLPLSLPRSSLLLSFPAFKRGNISLQRRRISLTTSARSLGSLLLYSLRCSSPVHLFELFITFAGEGAPLKCPRTSTAVEQTNRPEGYFASRGAGCETGVHYATMCLPLSFGLSPSLSFSLYQKYRKQC